MSHLINHYIENKELIPMLLDFGWIVRDNTWTDCPHATQKLFKTEEYYSRTTSKHITQYLNGREAEAVPQSFINQLVGV